MSNNQVTLSIGVITHTPYMENYEILIKQLLSQTSRESTVEIVTLVQLENRMDNQMTWDRTDHNFREYIIYETLSPSNARNFILNHTRGKWIAFIDGDCIIGNHYYETLKRTIEMNGADICGIQGAIYARSISRFGKYEFFYDIISLLEMETKEAKIFFKASNDEANLYVENCYNNLEREYVRKFQGFNFVISRELVKKIGYFNTEIETAEDREYSARVNEVGGKILFQKGLSVFHGYDMSLRRILKRKKWHALGCAYLRKKYNQVYDLNICERIIYSLDMFWACKKIDYLIYQIASDITFWGEVKRKMKKINI